jgi:hypothetical protein
MWGQIVVTSIAMYRFAEYRERFSSMLKNSETAEAIRGQIKTELRLRKRIEGAGPFPEVLALDR